MHFFLQIIFLHILNYFAITAPLSCIVPYLLSIYCMQAREKHSFGSNFHVIHFLPKSNIYLKTTLNILTMPITSGRLIFYDYQVDLLKRLFTFMENLLLSLLGLGKLKYSFSLSSYQVSLLMSEDVFSFLLIWVMAETITRKNTNLTSDQRKRAMLRSPTITQQVCCSAGDNCNKAI